MAHDLSHSEVELDYGLLLKTAMIAVRRSLWDCEQYISRIQYELDTNKIHNDCRNLAESAEDLRIASDTYHAIKEGESRIDKKIINCPAVIEV